MAAQYVFAAWYAVCGYLALAYAAQLAGHWYIPSFHDPYTTDADASADWAWKGPVTITIVMAPLIAWVSLFVSLAVFLIRGASGSRKLTFALIGSSALMVLVIVVSYTPAGLSVSDWLND
ncbi:hypothetical protein EV385_3436 [Krasilnikovia cinnamomea]|uniref:Uncharacterized protein n=2 Tax=Krasilnikovia cinnamomea TaxID=349313 RepID=A0A4Q7ZLW4_9ACTN|nr:hypothetical protein EV385_3436 [Krasilnikovia cinnamomea]